VAFVPLESPPNVNQTLAVGATLLFFLCPALMGATDRLLAGLPVYRFLYAGNFSNISPLPFMGAYHEAELPLLFGTDEEFRGSSTPLEKETSIVMQDSWVAFARAGVEGMEEAGWPLYTGVDGSGSLVRVFGAGVPVQNVELGQQDTLCMAMQNLAARTSST
jgi:carboxylesterase type B